MKRIINIGCLDPVLINRVLVSLWSIESLLNLNILVTRLTLIILFEYFINVLSICCVVRCLRVYIRVSITIFIRYGFASSDTLTH